MLSRHEIARRQGEARGGEEGPIAVMREDEEERGAVAVAAMTAMDCTAVGRRPFYKNPSRSLSPPP